MALSQPAELVLGTAQFGLDYGITNRAGRPSDAALDEILTQARADVDWLDTSIKYGDALDRLGRDSAAPYAIVTKIEGHTPAGALAEIELTLTRLGRQRLDAVLFHDPKVFTDKVLAAEVVSALAAEKSRGRVLGIGASLYDSREIAAALEVFTPDLLQLPANIADRRLLEHGVTASLERAGIAVHYRSAFLQGLLLSSPETLSGAFRGLAPLLEGLDRLANSLGTTRQALCISWVARLPAATGVVCGIARPGELAPLIAAYRAALTIDAHQRTAEIARAVPIDPMLLDPRRWLELEHR